MILTARYKQNVRVRPKGKRKFIESVAIATLPVVVSEASSSDAPIVCWWCGRAGRKTGQIAVRRYGDHFYEPVVVDGVDAPWIAPADDAWRGSSEIRLAGPETIEFFASRPWMIDRIGELRYQHNVPTPTVDDLLAELNHVEPMDSDRREASISQGFEKLLLIDGVLYSRSELPTFTTSLVDGRILPGSETYADMSARPGHRFVVAQFDRALALHDANPKAKEDASWMRPEIVRPEFLDVDLTSENISRSAQAVLRAVQHSHSSSGDDNLSIMPRAAIMAYGALRDAVAEGRPPADTLPLLRNFQNVFDGQGYFGHVHDVVEAILQRALEDGVPFSDPYESDLQVLGAAL